MIKFDGDRSKKRGWFARKKLATAKEIDIPASATMFEGFKVKVWQVGGVDGGSVTAPMGAVILCSTPDGIKIAVCDNWAGGCTAYYSIYVPYVNAYEFLTWGATAEELTEAGVKIIEFRPVPAASYYLPPIGPAVQTQSYSCIPSIMPYKGAESYDITISDLLFVDFTVNEDGTIGNGIPDFPYPYLLDTRYPYNSPGNTLAGRRETVVAQHDAWRTCQLLSDGTKTAFMEFWYDMVDGEHICASYLVEKEEDVTLKIIPDIEHLHLRTVVPEAGEFVTNPMPVLSPPAISLRDLMLDTAITTILPLGSYSFINTEGEKVFLHVSWFSTQYIPIGGIDHTIDNYFAAHPTHEKWRMFISFTKGINVHLIDASQFFTILSGLAVHPLTVGGVIDWNQASKMMKYLLPWPNLPGLDMVYFAWKPHDSVMFHGHDDKVYTWTRSAGAVRFDSAGMTAEGDSTFHLYVPPEVTDEAGVRPDITYAGDGYSAIYLCVCNKVADSVKAVYYGYPFVAGDWHKLPDPPKYHTLMQARPVMVTDDIIVVIGVMRYASPAEEGGDPSPDDVPTLYKFAQLTYNYSVSDEWKLMATLPFPIDAGVNFSMALFGNDAMVKSLLDYPSPPPCNPQNIVVPYDGYASFQP